MVSVCGGGGCDLSEPSASGQKASLANRLWVNSRKEAIFAQYSPFVVCLASGTLDVEVFRHYIAQDAHFLRAFAHAYEMAEECAAAAADVVKFVISELRNAALDELKMHNSVAKEWGIDLTKETTPNTATVKYTDFLQATAMGMVDLGKFPSNMATPFEKAKVAAYTIGAMTPCMRLYAFLGKELQIFMQPNEIIHPYKEWIDTYSSASFEASALQIEELLDRLSISLTGEELDLIEKLYNQAMRLEIEFFYAQPIVQRTVFPLTRLYDPLECHFFIFSDFDLTCTVLDSCAVLAEIAILTAMKADQNDPDHSNSEKSSTDMRNSWDALTSEYFEEYEQCIKNILADEEVNGFSYERLCKALEKVSYFEKLSNLRAIESGALKGLNLDDIKQAGESLVFQDGCVEFFQTLALATKELDADLHILSLCWCGDLIRAAFSPGGLEVFNVHSNEFCYEGSISTGEIVQKLESPLDKIQHFRRIMKISNKVTSQLSVYIGDSVGDLLCLLEADIGIVVGSSSSLRRIGAHFGVSFVPLFPSLVKKQRQFAEGVRLPIWKGLSGTLYTVSSWSEIHAFVLGA